MRAFPLPLRTFARTDLPRPALVVLAGAALAAWSARLMPSGAGHAGIALAAMCLSYCCIRSALLAARGLAFCSLAAAVAMLHAGLPIPFVVDTGVAVCIGAAAWPGRGLRNDRVPVGAVHASALSLAAGGGWLLAAASPGGSYSQAALLALAGGGLIVALRYIPSAESAAARAALAGLFDPGEGAARADLAPANSVWAYALEDDKKHFAALGGGVAYRLCAGVALAAGEPIGGCEDRLALASTFASFCRRRGYIPAFYQILDIGVDSFRAAGFHALKIGEEAMIDLSSFTLTGKRIANVRHCVTHVEREGVRAGLYLNGVRDKASLDGLDRVSDAWLGARSGRGEMGFSMGSYSRASMRGACVALARDAQGEVCAFVTWRHTADGGMVLDLMRRLDAAPSGVIDFLIARALEGFRDAGLRYASLSLAPLAGMCGDGCAPLAERLAGLLYEKGNGLYRYKSLYNFKKKFVPSWQARYLLYSGGPIALARVLLAVALVHTPRGTFLLPRPQRMLNAVLGFLRQCLDWRHGLQPGELALNVRLMSAITLICALPEAHTAVGLFASPRVPHAYAAFALALALLDGLGAIALTRRLDLGRVALVLGALGFFAKAVWGLGAGYDGGWLIWTITLALAPVEIWVVWFLLQPEVRAYLHHGRAGRAPRQQAPQAGVS